MSVKAIMPVMAMLVVGIYAKAQDNRGAITGYVIDASTKLPLFDAVVSLGSSEFIGKKFAVTDSTGQYKFIQLKPGTYTAKFEMEGYQSSTKDNIQVTVDLPVNVSLELTKGSPPRLTSLKF